MKTTTKAILITIVLMFLCYFYSLGQRNPHNPYKIRSKVSYREESRSLLGPSLLVAAGLVGIATMPSKSNPKPYGLYQYVGSTLCIGNGIVWGVQRLTRRRS